MLATNEIWIVDDDRSIRWVLDKALQKAALQSRLFQSTEDAMAALKTALPRIVVTDIRMPGISGIEFLAILKEQYPQIPVIIMTAYSDFDSAVSAYDGGAFEYLPKPFNIDEATDMIKRASQSAVIGGLAEVSTARLENMPEIIGESPAMQGVFRAVGRLMRLDATVLITGESGTGKELVAHALHRHSMRKDNAFIALNMAAIPKDLMESELFGYEKGAFTGANNQHKGRFEQADGGTLFMDEIGDMPIDLQTRLLRVLADGEFYRIGGYTPLKADVRIIAATHQDLLQQAGARRFREDLYHRLNVIRIHIPALRERVEDIPLLARHFLASIARELGVEAKTLSEEAEQYLIKMPWPGNVRQLENTCRWLTIMCHSREVFVRDLPAELQKLREQSTAVDDRMDWRLVLRERLEDSYRSGDLKTIQQVTQDTEQILIRSALDYTNGKKHEAAHLLGWGRNTLTRKIQKYGLE